MHPRDASSSWAVRGNLHQNSAVCWQPRPLAASLAPPQSSLSSSTSSDQYSSSGSGEKPRCCGAAAVAVPPPCRRLCSLRSAPPATAAVSASTAASCAALRQRERRGVTQRRVQAGGRAGGQRSAGQHGHRGTCCQAALQAAPTAAHPHGVRAKQTAHRAAARISSSSSSSSSGPKGLSSGGRMSPTACATWRPSSDSCAPSDSSPMSRMLCGEQGGVHESRGRMARQQAENLLLSAGTHGPHCRLPHSIQRLRRRRRTPFGAPPSSSPSRGCPAVPPARGGGRECEQPARRPATRTASQRQTAADGRRRRARGRPPRAPAGSRAASRGSQSRPALTSTPPGCCELASCSACS